jgi:predicted dehydrogenase
VPGAARFRPRLGFLGLGWIGRQRMEAVLAAGGAVAAALADTDSQAVRAAAESAPGAAVCAGLSEMLRQDLDGVVIATPSAMHAEQAIAALERGLAVFCQKPLGRHSAETTRVLEAARRADRRLGVDLSYRHTRAAQRLRGELSAGAIGRPYALELVFHNAYGPDKPWFTDRRLSGGGCLIDLGTHMVDLGMWLTGRRVGRVLSAALRHRGRPLAAANTAVEDFAVAQLELEGGITARLASSWFLPAGCECQFECTVIGTDGALALTNVGGSFYDFRLERRGGTASEALVEPPDDWGGRALVAWTEELGRDPGFDAAAAADDLALAEALDAIYHAGGVRCGS